MSYSFTDIATKKIEEVLSQNRIDDSHRIALKILRIIFDELLMWLDCKGVILPRMEIGKSKGVESEQRH